MQSILAIKTQLFRLLNVKAVNSLISGKIYHGKAPSNSEAQDVEIISLTNANDIVQEASLFINCHFQNTEDGQPDEYKMKVLSAVILPILEAAYEFTIVDEQVFNNQEKPGWAYYSIRVLGRFLNDNFVE